VRRARLPGGRVLWLVMATVLVPAGLRGQQKQNDSDREAASLSREAAIQESAGNFAEAEKNLRRVVEINPGRESAVFSLERVLRKEGKVEEILPVIDRYLEVRPNGTAMRHFQLRLLSQMDSLSALDRAARDWIRHDASSLETYRVIVEVFQNSLGPDRTLSVIRQAREATGRPDALALEAGDVLSASGDRSGAGREWSRAIGKDDRNLPLVLQRVEALSGNPREIVGALLQGLERDDAAGAARLQGAARLALAAGLTHRAVELADAALDHTDGTARTGFLVALGQRAEQRGASTVAIWAYQRIREYSSDPDERAALDQQIAELALAAGDTAVAMEARSRLASTLPEGSPERRRAMEAKGPGAWQPAQRERPVSAALKAYAAMTTSAAQGAVRDVGQLER